MQGETLLSAHSTGLTGVFVLKKLRIYNFIPLHFEVRGVPWVQNKKATLSIAFSAVVPKLPKKQAKLVRSQPEMQVSHLRLGANYSNN